MLKEPSEETLKAIGAVAKAVGSGSFHLAPIRVCDNCQDENKEAFPYGVRDRGGKHWDDLCNTCFDLLGCSYSEEDSSATEQLYDLFGEILGCYQATQIKLSGAVADKDEFNRRLSEQVNGWRVRLEELLEGTAPEGVEEDSAPLEEGL